MMLKFVLKRTLRGVFMLAFIFLCGLWIIRLIPGNYADLQQLENPVETEKGFSLAHQKPLFYFAIAGSVLTQEGLSFHWNGADNAFHKSLSDYLRFEFGHSEIDGVPVIQKFRKAWSWSLVVQLPALMLLVFGSLALAFESVLRPQKRWIRFLDLALIALHSLPGFWLATLLLLFFANPDYLSVFPTGIQTQASSNPWLLLFMRPQYFFLPVLCLALPTMAYLVRLLRMGLLESTGKWFWKRALSTGLSTRKALYYEALPLAFIPMLAWMAGILPALISGALVIEQIFSIPGLGRLLYQSIESRDWPTVQFLFFLAAAMTIAGFILADVLLRLVDPRIKMNTE